MAEHGSRVRSPEASSRRNVLPVPTTENEHRVTRQFFLQSVPFSIDRWKVEWRRSRREDAVSEFASEITLGQNRTVRLVLDDAVRLLRPVIRLRDTGDGANEESLRVSSSWRGVEEKESRTGEKKRKTEKEREKKNRGDANEIERPVRSDEFPIGGIRFAGRVPSGVYIGHSVFPVF